MLGVAVLIIVMSVMNGFRTELTSKIIGFNSHITIKPYNYSISDDYYLKLKEKFEKSEVIKTYNGEGVIIINDSAKGVMVKGIDKSQIKKIVFFKENIIDGNFNTINENEIIIGKYLAIELGVVVGDEINIMSSSFVSTPAGSIPKQSIFKIIGVFSSGMYEFDRNISFVNLKDSLSFFEKSNDDFNVEIYLQNPMNADLIKDQIQNMDKNFYVTSWTDLNKSFFSALKVERNVMFLIITLIIIVAAFNIISGLTILIKNKTKEIGILKSLGLSNNSIVKSFFLTGFLIGFFATVTGVILGVIFSIYIEEIRQFASLIFNIQIFPEDVYFLNEMPSELSFNSIFFISIFSILITIISSLIPSLTVTKIETIKALKYE